MHLCSAASILLEAFCRAVVAVVLQAIQAVQATVLQAIHVAVHKKSSTGQQYKQQTDTPEGPGRHFLTRALPRSSAKGVSQHQTGRAVALARVLAQAKGG